MIFILFIVDFRDGRISCGVLCGLDLHSVEVRILTLGPLESSLQNHLCQDGALTRLKSGISNHR